MRQSIDLDHLLENTVATALGLAKPHPEAPTKPRLARRRPARRAHRPLAAGRRSANRAAA